MSIKGTQEQGRRNEARRRDDRQPDADERRFNETLRKMLNTPPKPHKDSKKDSQDYRQKPPRRTQGR